MNLRQSNENIEISHKDRNPQSKGDESVSSMSAISLSDIKGAQCRINKKLGQGRIIMMDPIQHDGHDYDR